MIIFCVLWAKLSLTSTLLFTTSSSRSAIFAIKWAKLLVVPPRFNLCKKATVSSSFTTNSKVYDSGRNAMQILNAQIFTCRVAPVTWISISETWGSSVSTLRACVAANTWGHSGPLSANVLRTAATRDNPLLSDVPLSNSSVITTDRAVDARRATLIWNAFIVYWSLLSSTQKISFRIWF